MWSVRQAEYCSDFANGIVNSGTECAEFKSEFAQQLQRSYRLNQEPTLPRQESRISKVKTVICLEGERRGKSVMEFKVSGGYNQVKHRCE